MGGGRDRKKEHSGKGEGTEQELGEEERNLSQTSLLKELEENIKLNA